MPSRERLETVCDELALVEAAVEGARGLAQAIFGGGYRQHLCREPGLLVDFAGKVVPANKSAFVGGVVVAVLFSFVHVHEQARKVQRVGGRADLVVHHAHGIVSFAHVQHGLDKILAVQAEHPSDSHNKVLAEGIRNSKFTFELGLAVNVERLVIFAVGLPGFRALTVEHVVGADVGHLAAELFAGVGDVLGTAGVDRANLRHVGIVFGHVNCSPCGAMNHGIGLDFRKSLVDRGRICNVELHIRHGRDGRTVSNTAIGRRHVRTNARVAALCKFIHYIMAQLATHTCHKEFHIYVLLYLILDLAFGDLAQEHCSNTLFYFVDKYKF